MPPVTHWLLIGAGAVSLCTTGCMGPVYNPNGYWGAPGYSSYNYPGYGTPGQIQTLTPGSQYTPGMTPTPTPAGPTPTYGTGGSAPSWGTGTNVPVPSPSDPGNPYYPAPGENYRAPTPGTTQAPGETFQPISSGPSPSLNAGGADGTARLRSAALERSNGPAQPESSRDGEFDSAGYRWVVGSVSFDASDRTWSVVYDLDPTTEDRYAGHFTLAESPLLQTLRDGERVRLEGTIDTTRADRLGKPLYQVQRIIRNGA